MLSGALGWNGPGVPVHHRVRVLTRAMLALAGGGESRSEVETLGSRTLGAQDRRFRRVGPDSTSYRTTTETLGPEAPGRALHALAQAPGPILSPGSPTPPGRRWWFGCGPVTAPPRQDLRGGGIHGIAATAHRVEADDHGFRDVCPWCIQLPADTVEEVSCPSPLALCWPAPARATAAVRSDTPSWLAGHPGGIAVDRLASFSFSNHQPR